MKKTVLVLFLLAICSNAFGGGKIIMTTSDYFTGNTAVLDVESGQLTDNVLPHYQDATVRAYHDRVYICEGGDYSTIISSNVSGLNPPIYQYSVGPGSNPHDIILYGSGQSTKAYVLRYNASSIWVVDPYTTTPGSFKKKEIDISAWADADGSPEANQGFIHNGYIYVILQRYNMNTYSAGTAVLIRIDPETDTISDMLPGQSGVNGIDLIVKNPQGYLYGNNLYIAGTSYGSSDEGIGVVDLSSPIFSQTKILGEAALGGNAKDVVVFSEDQGIVFYYNPSFEAVAKRFNPQTGALGSVIPVPNPGGGALMVEGKLYMGSRSNSGPGVYILDPLDNYNVLNFKSTSLPPYSLTFADSSSLNIINELNPSAFELRGVYPNPVNSSSSIYFSLEKAGNVQVEIFDISGKKIATIFDSFLSEGKHNLEWSNPDLHSGVYLIRVKTNHGSKALKATILK